MRISIKQYWKLLAKYLRPQIGRVLLLAVFLFSNIGLQLVSPQIIRRFLDAALAGEAMSRLTTLALIFIAVAVVQQFVAIGATYFSENVGWTATNLLRYDLARHCLYLDMSFHNEHTPGEMIERIDGDVNALSNFFSQFILQILGNGLLMIGALTLLFIEDVRVGASITVFVLVTFVALVKMRNIAVPYWKIAREASARYFSFLEERLAGTEDIRASGAKAYVMRRFYELMRVFWQATVKARLMGMLMINTTWFLFAVGTATAFIIGATLYQRDVLTIGTVYMIVLYTSILSRPMEQISREIEALQLAGAGLARIQELLQVENKLRPKMVSASKPPAVELPGGALSVAFDDVSFAYESEGANGNDPEYVLQALSFQLEAGRVLGLLGRTGSGKTTITRLLFRLYETTQGSVSLGALDVRSAKLAALRKRVGMVTQNVQLFNASVRDNLTFFDPTVSDEKILTVIRELGLAGWYDSLGNGLDTVLSAGGGGLSAGEAQLLAFTRIFLKDPGLVILDEASSRLDPATEQLIEKAIDRLLQNRTAIIIAHRLKTVDRADEIMILHNGRVQEHGGRAQLAADSASEFYHLLQTGLDEVLV